MVCLPCARAKAAAASFSCNGTSFGLWAEGLKGTTEVPVWRALLSFTLSLDADFRAPEAVGAGGGIEVAGKEEP